MKGRFAAVAFLLAWFLVFTQPGPAAASEIKASDSQIRIWIRADGTLDVNEIHTYRLPAAASEVTRQFPESDDYQVHNFSAGEVAGGSKKIGEVTDENVRALPAKMDGAEAWIGVPAGSGEKVLIYAYQLEGPLSVYKEYSDLDITFFSGYSREFTGLENLEVSVVLPGNAGEASIRPFTRNMNGSDVDIRTNGLTFRDPVVEYPEEASYRVFFPSDVLSGAKKTAAPVTLEEAYAQEKEQFRLKAMMKPFRDGFILYGGLSVFLLCLLAAAGLFVPQRVPLMISRPGLILGTDPLYLHIIQRAGRFSPSVLDAAVFSLLEKGRVAATGQGPAKTYRLLCRKDELLPFERELVEGFFRREPGGTWILTPEDAESARNDRRLRAWQETLLQLFEDAGTISRKIPRIVLLMSALIPAAAGVAGAVADGKPVWWIAVFAVLIGLSVFLHVNYYPLRRLAVLHLAVTVGGAMMLDSPDVGAVILLAAVAYVIAWLLYPRVILSSLFAGRLKYAINYVAWKPPRQNLEELSPKEVQLWRNREDLLRKKRLPGQEL
ncbi:DUF2207 domain-containing protein [Edaphobacillus lindanitolerans]|uniref:Predicted membrane protein n=1 Tax=Edaphobacillus lindanitolerans TaxID=550447 RepID=A0A1U7PPA0_9BACI|nr:DUF2207 domain-containing protein [Edaphobacillus lindanitolerans]SIT87251.1 Predicted membrane protein [Edaphobacillus lindanitolerans]